MTGLDGRPPGHCVIIGVGPGLGAALARTFARAGHDLTLLSRSTTTGEQLIDELAPSGGAVRADVVDLADEHNIRLALTRAQDALG